jgi:hypothetical protein
MSFLLLFGLSAPIRMRIRVRFCLRVAVGFRAQFVYKVFRVLNLYHTPITTVCKQELNSSVTSWDQEWDEEQRRDDEETRHP